MSIYSLDSLFRQLFPLFQLFSKNKTKKLKKKKKNLFALSLKSNFQRDVNFRLEKIIRDNFVNS